MNTLSPEMMRAAAQVLREHSGAFKARASGCQDEARLRQARADELFLVALELGMAADQLDHRAAEIDARGAGP